MAVAVKTSPEMTTTRSAHQQLLISSLCGAGFVLVSFWLIFSGLPALWVSLGVLEGNPFLSSALLILASVPLIAGVAFVGHYIANTHPPHGARAGAFVMAALLLVILVLTSWIGFMLEKALLGVAVEVGMTAIVAAALVGGAALLFVQPGFGAFLGRLEDQGWFHATVFKQNQGLRVRRGTVAALLVLMLCGIYTLISHGSVGKGTWKWFLPFTATTPGGADSKWIPILFQMQLTVPLLLFFGSLWFAWRVVNYPVFGDFLIATEAEMNKVSWTTRKKLVQDTIVVLITVFLFTMFLFFVDILWIKVLSNPVLKVLEIDTREELAKQNAPTQW